MSEGVIYHPDQVQAHGCWISLECGQACMRANGHTCELEPVHVIMSVDKMQQHIT